MKKLITIFLSQILWLLVLHAQPCGPKPCLGNICNYNLTNAIFCTTDIHVPPSTEFQGYGKSGTAFQDVKYIEEDGCNTSNSCNTDYSQLKYNAYYPTTYNYVTCGGLPFIIFVHGGGNSDCSDFSVENVNGIGVMLTELARRGFVVFNINYRTGRIIDRISTSTHSFNSVQQQLARYKTIQDIRGAIRSIIQRQIDKELAGNLLGDQYSIDRDRMFLTGNSAGAIGVLGAAYYQTQTMINQVFPKQAGSSYSIQQTLGPIDQDFYYGGTNVEYFSKIQGIANLWGAVSLPNTVHDETDAQAFFATNTFKPPVISFYGKNDNVVNPNYDLVYFSPDNDVLSTGAIVSHLNYNTANNTSTNFDCVPQNYQLNTGYNSWDISAVGSNYLNRYILGPLGVFTENYEDCQMMHGLDCDVTDVDPACTTPFKSDFGTGFTMHKDVYTYMAQRIACFFQLVIARNLGISTGTYSKNEFIECVNNRYGCNASDNYTANCCLECDPSENTDKCGSKKD